MAGEAAPAAPEPRLLGRRRHGQGRAPGAAGSEEATPDLDQHVADVHVAGLRRGVQGGALVLVFHLEVGVDAVNCGRQGGALAGVQPRGPAAICGGGAPRPPSPVPAPRA